MLDAIDRGDLWPRAFCAFAGCSWCSMHGSEDALQAHLEAEHASDLGPIAAHMVRGNAPDAFLSIYNEGIAIRCRDQAPLAGCSIDRKALHTFVDACSKDNVEALVCFSCACIYTRVKELARKVTLNGYSHCSVILTAAIFISWAALSMTWWSC